MAILAQGFLWQSWHRNYCGNPGTGVTVPILAQGLLSQSPAGARGNPPHPFPGLGMLRVLCPGSGRAQPGQSEGQESRSSSTAAHFRGLWHGLGCQAGVPGWQGRSSLC